MAYSKNRMEAAQQSQSTAWRAKRGLLFPLLSAALALAGGLGLRLWMLGRYYEVKGDPLVYGDLAKNLLLHGRYALTFAPGVLHATLIRLPGYPLFLAACFKLFGIENYCAATYLQIGVELLGCLLLADFAARIARNQQPSDFLDRLRSGPAQCTLWLAALCPFTAVYAANPLTESLTLFSITLALWSVAAFRAKPGWVAALGFTFAVTFAALLRPDGVLAGAALAPAILLGLRNSTQAAAKLLRIAAACLLLAVTPFALWTLRNWQVFHVFQPLAPRYANDPGDETYPGWQRWTKTWCLDFVSTYEVYWQVPGNPLDLSKLPSRAFDSQEQYAETAAIAEDYNNRDGATDIVPDVDARFAQLAAERIRSHPMRYYLWLPLGRLADMLLRPRVENLNIDLDWWVYSHHRAETRFSWACVGLNALYLLLGIIGFCLKPRYWPWMLLYILLRSALLCTIEAPETRYTLEFFPIFLALGGIALYCLMNSVLELVFRTKASPGRD